MNALPRRCLLLAGLLAHSFAAACASSGAPAWTEMDYPGMLRPATALSPDVLWQQRITAHWGEDQQRGFDAAVQKQGSTLTVLGLSPIGAIGFVMLLRGTDIELQNQSGQELPFPPRFIVLDVQRTFYPWLEPAIGPDGGRTGVVGDERVQELWRDGRLLQRRFSRLDGEPEGSITITYDWRDAEPQRLAPLHTVLDNGWFHYRLTVDTHTETLLPAPPP
jgi:hypothetical protein